MSTFKLVPAIIAPTHYHLSDADHVLVSADESIQTIAEQVVGNLRAEGLRLGVAPLPPVAQVYELAGFLQRTTSVAIIGSSLTAHAHTLQALLLSIEHASKDGTSVWYGRLPRVYRVELGTADPRLSLQKIAHAMAQFRLELPTCLPQQPTTKSAKMAVGQLQLVAS